MPKFYSTPASCVTRSLCQSKTLHIIHNVTRPKFLSLRLFFSSKPMGKSNFEAM